MSSLFLLCFLFFEGVVCAFFFFFFNDTATTEIYTLSLHDALPILHAVARRSAGDVGRPAGLCLRLQDGRLEDRKSTRLNSSHGYISYAVFCLKKKKKTTKPYLINKKKNKNKIK